MAVMRSASRSARTNDVMSPAMLMSTTTATKPRISAAILTPHPCLAREGRFDVGLKRRKVACARLFAVVHRATKVVVHERAAPLQQRPQPCVLGSEAVQLNRQSSEHRTCGITANLL